MSHCSPRNVIVAKRERGPLTSRCESLPIGRDSRSAGRSDRGPSGVSLRVFIEREGEGSRGNLRGSKCCYQEGHRKNPGQNAASHTFAM
jgi:hypothetical protein